MKNHRLIVGITIASLSLAFSVPLSANAKSASIVQNPNLIQINKIDLAETDKGLELILEIPSKEYPEGEIVDYDTYTIIKLNNVTIANNANFLKDNPIPGIKTISVTQVNKTDVEIKIVGDGKLPKVEEFESKQGLIYSIAAEVNTASTPQPSENSQAPQPAETTTTQDALASNPDKIFITETTDTKPDDFKKLPFWNKLKAVQNNNVYTFHHDGLVSPTSISTVEEVTKQLRSVAQK